MRPVRRTLPKLVHKALEATGLPWSTEEGGCHLKIRLGGRLAGIVGRRVIEDQRTIKNTVSQIRRTAQMLKKDMQ
jgi:hypothetical protein